MNIVDRLKRRAATEPHAVAFRFLRDGEHETDVMSFGELYRQAQRIGQRLHALGATRERVLLLLPQDLRFVTAFFGCLCAGAVAVPVLVPRPRRPLSTLRSIVRDSEPKVVLATRDILDYLQPHLAADFPNLIWQCIEDADSAGDAWQLPDVRSEDLAFLQYTSGSTGSPKGVIVSHANLARNIEDISRAFGASEATIAGGWLPLYHDMGLVGLVLAPIYLGLQSVLMPAVAFLQKPERWLRMISKYRITVSGGPNFAYELCVDKVAAPQRVGLDLSSWQIAFNGAEPVRAATVERFNQSFGPHGFRASSMYPCYGMAEATLFVSGGACAGQEAMSDIDSEELRRGYAVPAGDDRRKVRMVGCGKPPVGTHVEIVDPGTALPVRGGKVGEIWIAGESVAQGYFKHTGADDDDHFHAHLADAREGPFLRTGDLGFVRNGVLYIAGRMKDVIIIRGRNYFPQDLEETAEQSTTHLATGAGAAFSIDIGGEERLILVHELKRSSLTADHGSIVLDIQQAIAAKHGLSAHGIVLTKPGTVPITSSGKLRRSACRDLFVRGELNPVYRYAKKGWIPSGRLDLPRTLNVLMP